MDQRPVIDFMTREVAAVQCNVSVRDVTDSLGRSRYSCLVVCKGAEPVRIIGGGEMPQLCSELLSG